MFKVNVWDCYNYDSCVGEDLFNVLKREYALNRVLVNFKDGSHLIVEKFNVIGWDFKSNVFNVYDNPSVDELICSFDFNLVESMYI